jgi:uncharacterized repeat protein (TIGR03803 family)
MRQRLGVILTVVAMAASLHFFTNALAQAAPPETTILSGPPSSSIAETADFVFTSSELDSVFACSLDSAGFTPCTSPASYVGLANGSHTFEVRAIGAIGGADPTPAAYAWTIAVGGLFKVLHYFDNYLHDNGYPYPEKIIQGRDGSLYGTTAFDGAHGGGTLFTVDASSGAFQVLHAFSLESNPYSGYPTYVSPRLVHGTDGNFYGTSPLSSGAGLIFKVDPFGNANTVVSFSGPAYQWPDGLIQGSDASCPALPPAVCLYGTTSYNGGGIGGSVYRITNGNMAVLHVFDYDTEGSRPIGTLVEGPDGNFYGTTASGPANQGGQNLFLGGTVYRMTPAGDFTVLHVFDPATEGSYPISGLVRGSDGWFYGTTANKANESFNTGTIYRIDQTGAFETVHVFENTPSIPWGELVRAPDGNLYGVTFYGGTYGGGTLFRLSSAGAMTVLFSFGASTAHPTGLTLGVDGALYGIMGNIGQGAVWRFDLDAAAKASQTITVTQAAPATSAFGTSFTVAATSSSGLAVAYSSGSPSVCTNNGATFAMVSGTGACIVQYDQPGNANYQAAAQVTSSTTAAKASQTITVTQAAPASAASGTSFTVAATSSSGLVVAYSSGSQSVCTSSGAMFTLVSSSGTCLVQYDQAGDANYAAAPRVTNSTTATAAAPYVDLQESNVSTSAVTVASGASLSVTDTVMNLGTTGSQGSTTRYYLSVNAQRDADDLLLKGSRSVPKLAAGDSSTGTASITLPRGAPFGAYYVVACADDTLKIVEQNETNNCSATGTQITIGMPDLIEQSVSAPPATGSIGSAWSVTDTVKNVGTLTAGASTTRFYLSADLSRDGGDVLLTGVRAVPSLNAGTNSTGTVTVQIPKKTSSGIYFVLACADDKSAVVESDEGNNCIASSGQITVP